MMDVNQVFPVFLPRENTNGMISNGLFGVVLFW